MTTTDLPHREANILIPMTFVIQLTILVGIFLLAIRLMLPALPAGVFYTSALILCSLIWSGFFQYIGRHFR